MADYPHSDDPLVQALQRLLSANGGHIAVAQIARVGDQSLYQIAFCKPDAKTGKPKGVGPSIRKRLDTAFPGWLTAPRPKALPPPDLAQALPVVLGRLPSLNAYRSGQVLAALQAAMQPLAPLEQIERDLLQWLAEPSTATSAHPAAATEKRQAQG